MSNINNLASSIFSQDRLIEVSNTLTVRVKHNYGRTLCYPVDDNAYAFLAIQGGKTLSDRTLERCLLYTSPSPRDATLSRMPSSA